MGGFVSPRFWGYFFIIAGVLRVLSKKKEG